MFGLEALTIAREGGARKPLGWSYQLRDKSWIVSSVDPAGPAAGLLEPGDRIAAIDGNANAATIGPRWILRDRPDHDSYGLTIERSGVARNLTLPWPTMYSSTERAWQWVHLATGVVYIAVALLVVFARPDSRVARNAVVFNMLTFGFFLTVVLETDTGVVTNVPLALALAFYFVRPLHFVAGYRFNRAFPLGDKSTPAWRRFEKIFYAMALVLWVPSVYGALLRSLGPERASSIAAAQYPFSIIHDSVVTPFIFLFAGVAGVANALVCRRNYKLVPAGDLQRRLRWISIGIGVGLLPIAIVAPLLFFQGVSGGADRLARTVHIVNAAVVIIPLCIGYAVVKHRVLGIRVVIRAGLRYLFARNVLRLAVAAPLVLIAVTIVSQPERTVGDLLLGPSGMLNIAMLLAAGLVLRYRTPMMQRIDRRFFREAYRQDQIFLALHEAIGKAADVPELARLLSSQIQSALHPRRVLALTRGTRNSLEVVYSSDSNAAPHTLSDFGIPADELSDLTRAERAQEIDALSADGHRVLRALGIALAVPIRGPAEGLVGLLLLGEKRSEEPYTKNDRLLLEATANQTGIVWENLQLKQALSREHDVRRQLTARLDGGSASIVLECPACGTCYEGDAIRCELDGRALTPSLPTTRVIDGKYRLNRVIGRGGMGAVYEATDLRLDRSVAVKAVTGAIFDDSIARQRFAREARASARITHPNVVSVFDLGEFDGGAYIVLEFLRGRTLRAELEARGPMRPEAAAQVLNGVFDGVLAAHAQQVVHRDLKPENIFLAEGGDRAAPVAKILDFGLAIARDIEYEDENKLTRTGTAVGTVSYMSPEQMVGERVDQRTDIHALGIIVLEMLTGPIEQRGPFFLHADAILSERLTGAGHSAEQHALAAVLRRAFNPAKEERYSSVDDFRLDLAVAIGNMG